MINQNLQSTVLRIQSTAYITGNLTILFNIGIQIKGLNVLNVRHFLPISLSQQLFVAYVSAIHDRQAVSGRTILVLLFLRLKSVFARNELEHKKVICRRECPTYNYVRQVGIKAKFHYAS